jgi:hypothetical protein
MVPWALSRPFQLRCRVAIREATCVGNYYLHDVEPSRNKGTTVLRLKASRQATELSVNLDMTMTPVSALGSALLMGTLGPASSHHDVLSQQFYLVLLFA